MMVPPRIHQPYKGQREKYSTSNYVIAEPSAIAEFGQTMGNPEVNCRYQPLHSNFDLFRFSHFESDRKMSDMAMFRQLGVPD